MTGPFNLDVQRKQKSQVLQLQQLLAWEENFLKQKSRCQ